MELEYCCFCDDATGRAGRGDDSIYRESLQTGCFLGITITVEQEIGPLCVDCLHELIEQGYLEED